MLLARVDEVVQLASNWPIRRAELDNGRRIFDREAKNEEWNPGSGTTLRAHSIRCRYGLCLAKVARPTREQYKKPLSDSISSVSEAKAYLGAHGLRALYRE